MAPRSTKSSRYLSSFLPILFLAACTAQPSSSSFASGGNIQKDQGRQDQILLGRHMVVSHACGECHGGGDNPAAAGWLDGLRDTITQQFRIGPFVTRAKNLTPDNATGTGRFSERQIFNALRYGLRPEETPDVAITSTVPGQGNSASPLSGGADAVGVVAQHVRPGALRDCGVPQGRTETGESQGAGQRRPA
jgi:hypothetical protein